MLQVNREALSQVQKFKYFGVAFTSDGRQDEKLDIRIGKAMAMATMRALHDSVVAKRELLKNGKILNFQNSLCPRSYLL